MSTPASGGSPVRLVIPPGQEAVVARMLQLPAALADGWALAGAAIQEDRIAAAYEGPGDARARIALRAPDGAPPKWGRTRRFAVGVASDAPGPAIGALYRAVLAAVRAGEEAFVWARAADHAGAADDAETARRARAAEGDIDLHLDLTPFVDLGTALDHRGAFAEALALRDRFVAYQSDARYRVTGWRGLALHALDGDPAHVATTDDDAGAYQDQSRYRLTEVAARCPITMAFLEQVVDLAQCRTVAFLMLLPGARIPVHVDGVGPPVMRSLNAALNMPAGCRLVIDCDADGRDNAYTRTAPFHPGSVLLLNVAKPHYVVNDSPEPRIHLVARGTLRVPALDLLALAEAQNGLAGAAAVRAALAVKRRVLAGEVPSSPPPPPAAAPAPSPYVGRFADAARARLLALLALGGHAGPASVGPLAPGSYEWRGEVEVRLPSGARAHLDVEGAESPRPAWHRTAHLACSYRAADGDPLADPRDAAVLGDLRDRLAQLDPPDGPPAPAVTELLGAVEAYRPFLPLRDEDFRLVFHGAGEPVGIVWLGFRCNQDCRVCWQGRHWPAPPDEVFDRWIAELCAAGVRELIFSGGEPTLHPRLGHWLRQAREAGVEVTLETNAIRLAEPDVLDALRESGLRSVVVSLHAATAEESDVLTGFPGSFARTVEGARAALASGLRVAVHCVVDRGTVDGLDAHAAFVAGALAPAGRRVAQVTYSFPIAYARRAAYRDAIVPFDVLRPRLSAAMRVLTAAGVDVRVLGTGGFTPCAVEDPAAALAAAPAEVTDAMRADRTFVEACAACSCRRRCLGVPRAYVAAHGARGIAPLS